MLGEKLFLSTPQIHYRFVYEFCFFHSYFSFVRQRNAEDNSPLQLFDELEIHPIILNVEDDATPQMISTFQCCLECIGETHDYGINCFLKTKTRFYSPSPSPRGDTPPPPHLSEFFLSRSDTLFCPRGFFTPVTLDAPASRLIEFFFPFVFLNCTDEKFWKNLNCYFYGKVMVKKRLF